MLKWYKVLTYQEVFEALIQSISLKAIVHISQNDIKSFFLTFLSDIIEPCHDKTNIMRLRPAWIQTSLRIRTV
jgi:hypothetical protein